MARLYEPQLSEIPSLSKTRCALEEVIADVELQSDSEPSITLLMRGKDDDIIERDQHDPGHGGRDVSVGSKCRLVRGALCDVRRKNCWSIRKQDLSLSSNAMLGQYHRRLLSHPNALCLEREAILRVEGP